MTKLLALALAALCSSPVAVGKTAERPAAGGEALRVLVVTGGHHYETTFYTIFNGQDEWEWKHACSNEAALESDIRDLFDVAVFYDLSRQISETARRNLVDFVESGKGIVVLHHAIASYNFWPWWSEEVVGGKFFLKDTPKRPKSDVYKNQDLVATAPGEHPITAGLGPLRFVEETYKNMWISPEVEVLLETENSNSDRQVAWISPYPKSRVVYIEMGHDRNSHLHAGFRQLVKNAIFWAGKKSLDGGTVDGSKQ